MRDSRLDSQSFVYSVEKFCQNEEINDHSTELLSRITPNVEGNFENRLLLKRHDLDFLIACAILSWYIPEEIGILLRLELEKYSQHEDLFILDLLIQNKGTMLCYLIETRLWHSRDFFGNILPLVQQVFRNISPVFKTKRRVKRVQRHRGYRDKGSLRMSHQYHSFAEFTSEQNELEERREELLHTKDFLTGFLS